MINLKCKIEIIKKKVTKRYAICFNIATFFTMNKMNKSSKN